MISGEDVMSGYRGARVWLEPRFVELSRFCRTGALQKVARFSAKPASEPSDALGIQGLGTVSHILRPILRPLSNLDNKMRSLHKVSYYSVYIARLHGALLV
jgi:hypothetical protein